MSGPSPRIDLPLRLAPRAASAPAATAAPAGAWFIPGGSPADWLDEIASWNVPTSDLRLAVLPRARGDLRPGGVLVLGAHGPGLRPAAVRRAQPWTMRAGRLCHPADAELLPPLADGEIAGLGAWALLALHPGLGPVGFAAGDLLAVADLLAPVRPQPTAWDAAQPGVAGAGRLTAVVAVGLPPLSAAIDEGGDGIGASAGELGGPRAPGAAGQAGRWLGQQAARALGTAARGAQGMLGRLLARGGASSGRSGDAAGGGGAGGTAGAGGGAAGGSAGAPWSGALGRLAQWAARLDDRLAQTRLGALDRLLGMLDRDPDRGLRHAIPLTGGAHRGLAPPGTSLGTRSIDFSLSGLGGGGPADPWEAPDAVWRELDRRYRALAERETALGRHRRAAYIYAHLLGDLHAAAAALERGGHHREAAALYRERLGRAADAARCLERGGLLDEAAALWQELGHHEEAGDCLARLGRAGEADACWRRAAQRLDDGGDALAAAALLERKCGDDAAALALLAGTWPAHPQAGQALQRRFALLGRLGRHGDSRALVSAVCTAPSGQVLAVAEAMAGLVAGYPDRGVQAQAADAGRAAIGRHLAAGGGDQPLAVLARLDPRDRLLASDAARWRERRTAVARPPARKPAERPGPVNLVAGFRVDGATWQAAAGDADGLVLIGRNQGGGLFAARATWDGRVPALRAWSTAADGAHELFLTRGTPARAIAWGGGTPLPVLTFPGDDSGAPPLSVGTPGPLMPGAVASGAAAGSDWWLLRHHDGAWLLSRVNERGPAVLTRQFAVPTAGFDDPGPRRVGDCAGEPVVAGGSALLCVAADGVRATSFTSPVRGLVDDAALGEATVLIAHPLGATACRLVHDGWLQAHFADDFTAPLLGVTRDGLIIAIDRAQPRGRLFRLIGGRVRRLADFATVSTGGPGHDAPPILVSGTDRLDRFAVVHADGAVRIYGMQGVDGDR